MPHGGAYIGRSRSQRKRRSLDARPERTTRTGRGPAKSSRVAGLVARASTLFGVLGAGDRPTIERAAEFIREPLRSTGWTLPTEMRERYEQVIEQLEAAIERLEPDREGGMQRGEAERLVRSSEQELLSLDHIQRPGGVVAFQDMEQNYGRLDAHRLLYKLLNRHAS
jgi:hypothetical protein